MSSKAWIIIPAAGVGKRMQADIPKQYLMLHGRTVIEHTLACFTHHPQVAGIIIALHPNDPYWPELEITSDVALHIVDGGSERADSVFSALSYLKNMVKSSDGFVLVHDAARPCLSCKDLDQLLEQGRESGKQGAILAMPVRDTMKREEAGHIAYTVDRSSLWHALTPQMFRIDVLYHALEQGIQNNQAITDEASALELIGVSPLLVEGEASNIKITRPADLQLAAFFLQQAKQELE